MTDDFLGGVLPADDLTGDTDFDPNAVESDDFLDDPKELALDSDVLAIADEDDDFVEEI